MYEKYEIPKLGTNYAVLVRKFDINKLRSLMTEENHGIAGSTIGLSDLKNIT